jgi:lysyl-tRNA synthetase class 2
MIASVLNRHFSGKLFYLNNLHSKHISVKLGAYFQAEKSDELTKSEKLSENEKYMKHRFEHFFAKNEKLKQTDLLYPHKFENTLTVEEFVKKFDHLKPSENLKDEIVKISGRIFSIRISGKKLRFLDLQQNEFRVQIKAESKEYNQEFEKFETDFEVVRRGDVVGVTGFPCRTKMGELSIVPVIDGFKILAPSLRILPSGTLEKPDHKYRRRYLDLMLNPIVRQNFKARSEIVKSIREFLDSRDFVEVETPILCPNVGGASATPFKTRHLDLDIDMFLRFENSYYDVSIIIIFLIYLVFISITYIIMVG